MIDEAFGRFPSSHFQWVIDFNTLADLRNVARAKVVSHLNRVLAIDGRAVFFHLNPDHLTMRMAARFGARKSGLAQRRPSVVAFRKMLRRAGFEIVRERAGRLRSPAVDLLRTSGILETQRRLPEAWRSSTPAMRPASARKGHQ